MDGGGTPTDCRRKRDGISIGGCPAAWRCGEPGVPVAAAGRSDRLADTLDYSRLIQVLQALARRIHCQTLEHYAERILQQIASDFGPLPVVLELRKWAAPVPGFSGQVGLRRCGPLPPASP